MHGLRFAIIPLDLSRVAPVAAPRADVVARRTPRLRFSQPFDVPAQSNASATEASFSDSPMLSGGEALMRALSDEGVRLLFGYPGGAALHIYDALFRQDAVQHVLVRHEQAAAHAADGYARATGEVGVVLVTSGPGATNTLTGIATAGMDSIPIVVISAQVPSAMIGTDFFQETDMIGASRPLVKHSFLIQDAARIPSVVRKAFHIASSGRQGPVVIDVPKDMTDPQQRFAYRRDEEMGLRGYAPPTAADPARLDEAASVLIAAKRPMVYSGGGVVQGEASEALRALARMLNAPVTNTLMGLGAYPASDRQFVGMLGMHGHYEANMAMHHCDALLAVGARFDDRVTNTPAKFCPEADIIHIDIDDSSIDKTIRPRVALLAPAGQALSALAATLQERGYETPAREEWWQQIDAWRASHGLLHGQRYACDGQTIMPQQVVQALHAVTGGDAYVSSDVGQHQMFAAQYYGFDKPRRWLNSGGLGTMGFGLPAAMGAALAHPDATVVCVTGEGSIQMCIQELSTCTQYRLPIKIVNINNQALGMVRQWQDMQYGGRYSSSTYQDSLPDFAKLAEAYGHVGIRVERLDQLDAALERGFAMRDRLVFFDILVDHNEHVYPMLVAPNGSMRDMWLSRTERS